VAGREHSRLLEAFKDVTHRVVVVEVHTLLTRQVGLALLLRAGPILKVV